MLQVSAVILLLLVHASSIPSALHTLAAIAVAIMTRAMQGLLELTRFPVGSWILDKAASDPAAVRTTQATADLV